MKAVYRDLRGIWDKLQLHTLATPPIKKPAAGLDSAVEQYDREQLQYKQWMKLLEFERENQLALEDAALRSRVRHVFKHALCYIRFYPEACHAFAQYEEDSGDIEAAMSVYRAASDALPRCLFINFAHADFLERVKKVDDAREVYTQLRAVAGCALVDIQLQQFMRRTHGVEAAREVFREARESQCSYEVYVAAAQLEFYANKEEQVARNIFEHGFRLFAQEPGFVLQYIDFLSHRNDDNSTYFETPATPGNTLHNATKHRQPCFLSNTPTPPPHPYLNIHTSTSCIYISCDVDTRVLFERALHVLAPERAKPVWDAFLTFEHTMARGCGDLAAVKRLETRRTEVR